ncbi:MAG: MBL fold metallo-hydrolase [Patulibacter sp.]|nr:MBL fold metallo-hydrolase [Patulibacter sp.]
MRELADGVFHLPLMPRSGVNAYLVGDVLVDAGFRWQAKRVLAGVRGRIVRSHVLTHAHVDHAGGTRKVIEALGVPVLAGERDLPAMHSGQPEMGFHGVLEKPGNAYGSFPAVPEATALHEGDAVGDGFTVLDTPGHSPGHISLWRERDGVLICGDVINNMNLLTTVPGVRQPPTVFTPDPAENRRSIRRLAELDPRLVLVGHGPPLKKDAAGALKRFAADLGG